MKIVPYPPSPDNELLKNKSMIRLDKLIEMGAPEPIIKNEAEHLLRLLGTSEVGTA
ncbi:MAG TPA: hypothetical protein VKW06_00310 [Candidatus Angelobacter sp.]|nr:hypothetical protein [Candidatus Angelobacter sp.]